MNAPAEQDRVRERPASPEAEHAVLGSLLQDPASIRQLDVPLRAEHFFIDSNRVLFAELDRRIAADKPTDLISVFQALHDQGLADRVGGLPHLNALEQSVPSAKNIARWAAIVREKAALRSVIAAADSVTAMAFSAEPDVAGRAAEIFACIERSQVAKAPRRLAAVAKERADHHAAVERGDIAPGWPTRIAAMDRLLTGFQPGWLYILGARPSVGKSSFSLFLAQVFAEQGLPTLFLSLEMPETQVADRAVVQLGHLNASALRTGKLGADGWSSFTRGVDRLAELPLFVDDTPGLTLSDIKAKARGIKGLKVLVLDYLQLCSGTNPKDTRNGQLEEITRGLKVLAKTENIAVIALSQLNRAVEARADRRPTLADLRDCGGIEQDADAVLFLWRVRAFKDSGRQVIGCALEKQRDGPTGVFALDFHGPTQRWTDSNASLEEPRHKRSEDFE